MLTKKKIENVLGLVNQMVTVGHLDFTGEDLKEFEEKLPELLHDTVSMLPIADVARKLCVSNRSVYNWIREGKIQAFNLTPLAGKPTLRIKKSDLNTIMTDAQATPYQPTNK